MGEISCGKIPDNVAEAIEAADWDAYNFFDTVGLGGTGNVVVEEDYLKPGHDFQIDYAWAFSQFADSLAALTAPQKKSRQLSSCVARVNDLKSKIPPHQSPVWEMEIALSQTRIDAIAAFQKPGEPPFFENSKKTHKIKDKATGAETAYPLARLKLDLDRYFSDARYEDAFNFFRDNLKKYSADLMNNSQQMDPDVRSLYFMARFPSITFDLPMIQEQIQILKGFDNSNDLKTEDLAPFGGNPVLRFEFNLNNLHSNSFYRDSLGKYAKNVVAYYDHEMAEKNYSIEQMDPDVRNLYSLHASLLAYARILTVRNPEAVGEYGAYSVPPTLKKYQSERTLSFTLPLSDTRIAAIRKGDTKSEFVIVIAGSGNGPYSSAGIQVDLKKLADNTEDYRNRFVPFISNVVAQYDEIIATAIRDGVKKSIDEFDADIREFYFFLRNLKKYAGGFDYNRQFSPADAGERRPIMPPELSPPAEKLQDGEQPPTAGPTPTAVAGVPTSKDEFEAELKKIAENWDLDWAKQQVKTVHKMGKEFPDWIMKLDIVVAQMKDREAQIWQFRLEQRGVNALKKLVEQAETAPAHAFNSCWLPFNWLSNDKDNRSDFIASCKTYQLDLAKLVDALKKYRQKLAERISAAEIGSTVALTPIFEVTAATVVDYKSSAGSGKVVIFYTEGLNIEGLEFASGINPATGKHWVRGAVSEIVDNKPALTFTFKKILEEKVFTLGQVGKPEEPLVRIRVYIETEGRKKVAKAEVIPPIEDYFKKMNLEWFASPLKFEELTDAVKALGKDLKRKINDQSLFVTSEGNDWTHSICQGAIRTFYEQGAIGQLNDLFLILKKAYEMRRDRKDEVKRAIAEALGPKVDNAGPDLPAGADVLSAPPEQPPPRPAPAPAEPLPPPLPAAVVTPLDLMAPDARAAVPAAHTPAPVAPGDVQRRGVTDTGPARIGPLGTSTTPDPRRLAELSSDPNPIPEARIKTPPKAAEDPSTFTGRNLLNETLRIARVEGAEKLVEFLKKMAYTNPKFQHGEYSTTKYEDSLVKAVNKYAEAFIKYAKKFPNDDNRVVQNVSLDMTPYIRELQGRKAKDHDAELELEVIKWIVRERFTTSYLTYPPE